MAIIANKKFRKVLLISYFSGLVLLPIVLIILPADFFDNGPPICLSVLLFHQKCYACGMSRATQHLIHGDFTGAADFNKLAFVVFPLLVFLWGEQVWVTYKKLKYPVEKEKTA